MTRFVPSWVAIGMLSMCASLVAQDDAVDETAAKPKKRPTNAAEPEEPQDINYLPKPFRNVRTNVLALEQSGYFAVDNVELRTRGNGDEAIVWTLRVRKAVTCRHIESMLQEFRDARFYATLEERRIDILGTLVQYSDRIVLGASNGKLLGQDDVFEMWIDLPDLYYRKLKTQNADTLVLRRWKY